MTSFRLGFVFLSACILSACSEDDAVTTELLDDATGEFKQTVEVELKEYDAGTEEGNGFSLSNPDTSPKQPIALLSRNNTTDHDFFDGVGSGGAIIGTMTFERLK